MSWAMVIDGPGDPDVFYPAEIEPGTPGPGQVRLRQSVIGVNFVDIYHRTGMFDDGEAFKFPAVLGVQAVGTVESLGPDVVELAPGDRVGYVGTVGAYTSDRVVPARRLIRLPDDVSDGAAAASLVRGLTAEYLLRRVYPVAPGEVILVHAAAGGVGVILCQWAKALGATVIGTVSTPAKAEYAAAHGCEYPIIYRDNDWVGDVMRITRGEGVPVVYDSIGKDTFLQSLQCLRPRGLGVNFGTASGQVDPFSLHLLLDKSLSVTRPTLRTFVEDRDGYENAAKDFFEVLRQGVVRLPAEQEFQLRDVAAAHRALQSRSLTGLPVLIP